MISKTKPFGVSGSARKVDTSQFSEDAMQRVPEEGADGSGSEGSGKSGGFLAGTQGSAYDSC